MRVFVVDTNIVFSGILNTNSRIGQLLIKTPRDVSFFSSKFLHGEIARHRPKLEKITRLSVAELVEIEQLVTNHIAFIDESLVDEILLLKAEEILQDIDIDDAPFLALALQLDCKIWTGDKKLREGLLAKGFNHVINTEELVALIQSQT